MVLFSRGVVGQRLERPLKPCGADGVDWTAWVGGPIWFLAAVPVSLALGTIFHEGGHYFFAWVVGIPVRRVLIGNGPIVLSHQFGDTSVELRLFPFGGGVLFYPDLLIRKYRWALVLVGGVLGNILLLGLPEILAAIIPPGDISDLAFGGLVATQVFIIFANLLPLRLSIESVRVPSDGLALLGLLLLPRAGLTESGMFYAAILRAYSAGREPLVTAAPASQRICYQFRRADESWFNEHGRHERSEALLCELDRGGLMPEEELLVLDALITDALLRGDPQMRVRLEEWSRRALEIGPDIATLRGSRGAALVDLGRAAEGKGLLEPLVGAAPTSFDALLSHIFLARAEHALGNMERSRYLAAEARAISHYGTFPPAAIRLLESLETEVENTQDSALTQQQPFEFSRSKGFG
jgi:peptidase M50-like protein